jgi:hypothetical protein
MAIVDPISLRDAMPSSSGGSKMECDSILLDLLYQGGRQTGYDPSNHTAYVVTFHSDWHTRIIPCGVRIGL